MNIFMRNALVLWQIHAEVKWLRLNYYGIVRIKKKKEMRKSNETTPIRDFKFQF